MGIFLILATVGYYAGAEQLVSLFMKNDVIISYGSKFLRGLCLASPFLAVDFLAVGVFQACGMGTKSLIFALMRKIVLEIPALYLLNALFPLYGLAYAQMCAEIVLAVIAMIVLMRLFKNMEKEGR